MSGNHRRVTKLWIRFPVSRKSMANDNILMHVWCICITPHTKYNTIRHIFQASRYRCIETPLVFEQSRRKPQMYIFPPTVSSNIYAPTYRVQCLVSAYVCILCKNDLSEWHVIGGPRCTRSRCIRDLYL